MDELKIELVFDSKGGVGATSNVPLSNFEFIGALMTAVNGFSKSGEPAIPNVTEETTIEVSEGEL